MDESGLDIFLIILLIGLAIAILDTNNDEKID